MTIYEHSAAEQATFRGIMVGPFRKVFLDATGDDGLKVLEMIGSM